jgi:DNA-binding GntR family transcriptional regulator
MQSDDPSTVGALTRSEELVRLLRAEIVTNRLAPGARITEESLAEQFGVSRTPVREALRVLAREALLEYRPHAGYSVAAVSLDDLDDLYTIRVSIEEQVMARLGGIVDLDALRPLEDFWGRPRVEQQADVALVFSDEAFHEALADASGSSVFSSLLRNLNHRLHVLRIRDFADQDRVQRTFEQHWSILRAIRARDTRLAQALVRAHIWQSYGFVRSTLEVPESSR